MARKRTWLDWFFGPWILSLLGIEYPERPTLNLIPGSGVTITAADNQTTDATDVTISSTGGGGGVTPAGAAGAAQLNGGSGALAATTTNSFLEGSTSAALRVNGTNQLKITNAGAQCAQPRTGLSTAWGASEGETTVTTTGAFSVQASDYSCTSVVFSGTATATATWPSPSAAQSYKKFCEETGGHDKVMTTGAGTTYTLKANTRRLLKFTNNGVFDAGADAGVAGPAKQQTVDITSGNQTVDLGAGRILKFTGSNGGTPVITITPQATTDALADRFKVRNKSSSTVQLTTAISGKTAIYVPSGALAEFEATPDGISGWVLNSDGTIGNHSA